MVEIFWIVVAICAVIGLLTLAGVLLDIVGGLIWAGTWWFKKDKTSRWPDYVERTWDEHVMVDKERWCEMMSDSSYREEWKRWIEKLEGKE